MNFRGGLVMFGACATRPRAATQEIAPPPGPSSVYVVIDDADALHDRVVAAGGDESSRRSRTTTTAHGTSPIRDPEGNIWSFGTYDPWAA